MPQPTNRLELGTRRGITAQTVIQHMAERAAESIGANGRGGDSLAERIGNAALAGLLRRFEEDGLIAPIPPNGGTTMKDVVEAFRAVHEVARDQDDRRHQRLRELQEENEALRTRLQTHDGTQAVALIEMMKVVTQMQQQSQQQMMQLIERIEERNRQMILELRQYIDRQTQDASRIDRLLEELRRGTDPVEIAQKYRALREAFGLDQKTSGPPNSLPLELLPKYWEVDLERYRIDREHERELRQQEVAEKRAEALQNLLREVAQTRLQAQAQPPATPGAGQAPSPTNRPARYRYVCDACGQEFVLPARVSRATCPHCSAELEVVVDGHRPTEAADQSAATPNPSGRPDLDSRSESL